MTKFLVETIAKFNGMEIRGKKHATQQDIRDAERKLAVKIKKVKNEVFLYLTGEKVELSPEAENVVHFLISYRRMVLNKQVKYTPTSKNMVYEMLKVKPNDPMAPAVDAFITGKNYFSGKSIRRFSIKDVSSEEDISYAYIFNVPFDVVDKVKKAMEIVSKSERSERSKV